MAQGHVLNMAFVREKLDEDKINDVKQRSSFNRESSDSVEKFVIADTSGYRKTMYIIT